MREHDVGINLHNEPYPSFENRVCLHLAAGHLVLTEPLSPAHGLEPGIDFLEIRDGKAAAATRSGSWGAFRTPGAASACAGGARPSSSAPPRVWPRLLADLLADVAARGGRRS